MCPFYNAQLFEITGTTKGVFTHSQSSCHIAKVVLAFSHDSRQIPIASDAPPRHTSRGFLHWRLSDDGPGASRIVPDGRHPKPFTEAAIAKRESATSPLFAGHYPSSKVVTPNTRSSRNGGIAPVYIRAVSNTGASPRSCANATASRLMLGTSRKISPQPTLASRADRTTSAVARSSATSGPILQPF